MKKTLSILAIAAAITALTIPAIATTKCPQPPAQKYETIVTIAQTLQEAAGLVDHYLESTCKQVGQVMPVVNVYSRKKGPDGKERVFPRIEYFMQFSCPQVKQ